MLPFRRCPPPLRARCIIIAQQQRWSTIPAYVRTFSDPITPAEASTPPPPEPYFVRRTRSGNYPVYQLAKRGGNLKQTTVKKIEGDVGVLRAQLVEELGVPVGDVTINQLTDHIVLKGHRKKFLEQFLQRRGF